MGVTKSDRVSLRLIRSGVRRVRAAIEALRDSMCADIEVAIVVLRGPPTLKRAIQGESDLPAGFVVNL